MPYSLVFDFGGVLMKTATREPRWKWDDRLGLPRGTVEQVVHGSESWRQAQHGSISTADYWADVAGQLAISADDVRQLEIDFFSGDRLDLTLVDFIRARKQAGQRVALLSNDSIALLDKLTALGIANLFDPLVISAHIGVMKPAPASYQHVLDILGGPASDAVFIDDMPANIEGARAVGMTAIHYTPEIDLPAALTSYN